MEGGAFGGACRRHGRLQEEGGRCWRRTRRRNRSCVWMVTVKKISKLVSWWSWWARSLPKLRAIWYRGLALFHYSRLIGTWQSPKPWGQKELVYFIIYVLCIYIYIYILEHLGASGSIWEHLGASGSIWKHMGASGSIWEHLGASCSIWEHPAASGSIWGHGSIWEHLIWKHLGASGSICMGASGNIWEHLYNVHIAHKIGFKEHITTSQDNDWAAGLVSLICYRNTGTCSTYKHVWSLYIMDCLGQFFYERGLEHVASPSQEILPCGVVHLLEARHQITMWGLQAVDAAVQGMATFALPNVSRESGMTGCCAALGGNEHIAVRLCHFACVALMLLHSCKHCVCKRACWELERVGKLYRESVPSRVLAERALPQFWARICIHGCDVIYNI